MGQILYLLTYSRKLRFLEWGGGEERNFNPSQKTSPPPPPPTHIYTPLEQSQPLEKNLDLC